MKSWFTYDNSSHERLSWFLFCCTSILVGLSFIYPFLRVRALYSDAELRTKAQSVLELVAEQKGLVLSGVEIRSIHKELLTIAYWDYQRGADGFRCIRIGLTETEVEEIPDPMAC